MADGEKMLSLAGLQSEEQLVQLTGLGEILSWAGQSDTIRLLTGLHKEGPGDHLDWPCSLCQR